MNSLKTKKASIRVIEMVDYNIYINKAIDAAVFYAPKVLLAVIVLLVGLRLIKYMGKLTRKAMDKKNMEESLKHFLVSLISIFLKVILVVTVISMVGVETTSFVAVLAAAGFAIGMALQGSLGNFAGGVLILLFKPFKVGDVIEAQGQKGKVSQIEIFNTIIKTPDNQTVIVPNGILSNGIINNLSTEKTRRVDLTFGIGYDDDLKKAQQILNKIVNKHNKILKDPAPFVRVAELGDSTVNFTVRAWAEGKDYWDVHFDLTEQVKLEFDKEKISIPYPQMDVHLHK